MSSVPITQIVVLFLFSASVVNGGYGDKVRLKDVETLTLHHGQYTNGRRSAGVPQIKCVGGGAGCYVWTPSTVQCYNRGFDGHDTQWECKSEMPIDYKFGTVSVTCEGYDYPDDPYVLRGSCGLEYKLEYNNNKGYASKSQYRNPGSDSRSTMGSFLVFLVIALIIVGIVYSCIQNTPGNPNTGAGYPGTQAPPPAGFRSHFYPDSGFTSSSGDYCDYSSTAGTRARNSGGGGFWTGAATGGILGYMLGRNNNQNNNYGYGFQSPGTTESRRSEPSFGSSSSSSTHTSSGFGGTKRR